MSLREAEGTKAGSQGPGGFGNFSLRCSGISFGVPEVCLQIAGRLVPWGPMILLDITLVHASHSK